MAESNLESIFFFFFFAPLYSGLQHVPLESLELAFCYLHPVDLSYLTESHHAGCLKKLDLSGNNLSESLLLPFQQLLRVASVSLLYLDIMECRLMDHHLISLLPALRCCTHLRYLGCFCNPVSTQGLKTLLQNALLLWDLKLLIHPFPIDCYEEELPWPPSTSNLLECFIDREKLSKASAELQEVLMQAERTDLVLTPELHNYSPMDYFDF
nr:PREDICTED: leucine-rich repeat-containing protein 14 [Latimeria chalumnae]|eukprot:XP_005999372.1 PREDICTED: leucine-rich repeat-containing protein 14 [Latimeria chalumnae]